MTETTEPRLLQVQCANPRGLHRMAYWEWPSAAGPSPGGARRATVCVHGLSRQGRDFDALARSLSAHGRVVCPDVVGRGRSDWLPDPMGYGVPQYVADMVTLIARLDVDEVDWVGTSMGGLIGMMLAALPGSPIRRLVLNDVGPAIEYAAIERIGAYLGQPMRWPSEQAAADALWAISQGFGPHTPGQWLELTRPQLKRDGEGEGAAWVPRSDPGIAVPFRLFSRELAAAGEAALWQAYDAIRCPTLLLRGAQSDLLSAATAAAMQQRGPKAALVSFDGVGHAPTLIAPAQQAAVQQFLQAA